MGRRKKRVAVEDGLRPFREFLEREGYEVIGLSREDLNRAQAVVLSGTDDNVMNMEDITTRVPVISAEGRTPEEVKDELEARIH